MKTYSISIEFLDYEQQELGRFEFGDFTAPLDVVLHQVSKDVEKIEKSIGEVINIIIEFQYEVEGGN